ncbi:MAG: TonB-dependent receptor [Bacteroidales bacterium]|nr:TonB-dependent receptor [Bacteroidales bacterium]
MKKLIKSMILLIAALGVSAIAHAQGKSTIIGTVIDQAGLPIAGAAVMSSDGAIGTVSDLDGKFQVQIGNERVAVTVSCLGYDDKNVILQPKTSTITVTLSENALSLDATIMVGYGSQKKSNLTGALSVIDSKELKDRSSLDVGHMLQGTVPGLNITSPTGRPGQAADINIRGWNSINGGSPLILIDGVEGDLQKVSSTDVESISVIKDAAAAAIYGARASFGVILITTKNGEDSDGTPTISYSGRFGFTAPTTSTEYENRGYYSVKINNDFFKSYAGVPYATYTEADMQELYDRRNDVTENDERPWVVVERRNGRDVYNYYANTDWYHYYFRDIKPTTSHSISFSGGSKKFKYLLSGSYNREEGVFHQEKDIYTKFTLRAKMSLQATKWLNISNNINYFKSSYAYPGFSGVNNAFSNATVHALASYPVANPDGTAVYSTQYNSYTLMNGMPMALNGSGFHNQDSIDYLSNTAEITIKPIKQLEIKANYTYTFNFTEKLNRSVNGTYSLYPGVIEKVTSGRFINRLAEGTSIHKYQAVNAYATYTDTFAENHNFKAMVGFNFETKHLKDISAYGYNLLDDSMCDLDLLGVDENGEIRAEVGGGQNEYAIMGFFGRINYDYKGKYLFEVSGRYDGTSRFASTHRWGFFPSASAGWRISEEDFFAPAKSVMNNLKIRYSFGRLGNQQVGYYDYLRTMSLGTQNYLFGGPKSSSATISAPVASDLTWETIQQHNLGIDAGFFNNRLNFTGEAYIRDTKDMLTAGIALPAVYGASAPKMNSADLRTKGYELSISWRDQFNIGTHAFQYNASFIFSDYVSHITKFDNPERSFAKNYWVGMKYGDIYGYHILGYFESDEEAANWDVDQGIVNEIINSSTGEDNGLRAGDLKYADLNNNHKIDIGKNTVDDPGDRRVIGNSQPRFNYGINLGIKYFGFDLSVFLQGIGKQDWYPEADSRLFWNVYARPYMTFIPKNFLDDCWTPEHPDAYFPRQRGYVAMSTSRELGAVNDRYLQNIGYCRLKNLTFGYSLPSDLLAKAKIKEVRIYFTGENLAYICPGLHSKYIDPEMAMAGGTQTIYPWQKTFMFGIDIKF